VAHSVSDVADHETDAMAHGKTDIESDAVSEFCADGSSDARAHRRDDKDDEHDGAVLV